MFFYRPDLAAPERLSLREAAWCAHRKISKIPEIRRAIRRRRLFGLPDVCTGRHAAWGLVVPPHVVKKLVESGQLQAERIYDDNGRYKYEITGDDVRAVAKELDAEPTASDESRVERIREESFERRGGEPR